MPVKSIEDVEQISDLMERVKEASALEADARKASAVHREVRNRAGVIAHLDYGVPPIAIYRDLLGISRGMFKRYLDRKPSDEERRQYIADQPRLYGSQAAATATAKRYAEKVDKANETVERAREVRDVAALLLMEGRTETGERVPPVPNAEIVRATSLTSARVSQLRKGSR